MIARIEEILKHDVAGDPCTGLKWTRRTARKIAKELRALSIAASAGTVARLLDGMDFSLHVNRKSISKSSHGDRNDQFIYISEQRTSFANRNLPIVGVDSKKKEMAGNFKNPGKAWGQTPELANDHGFRSDAEGMATLNGIYDASANCGAIFVGISHDTPCFAAENIARWWEMEGRGRYPGATELLVLADGGGSNGMRCRAFKYQLQTYLCDTHGLSATLCHYPAGASKWNPIEHRLFSEISKNWAGCPLRSYETILNYIATTKTETGLHVTAHLVDKEYQTGVKITDTQMATLNIHTHEIQPLRNYTIQPRR